MTDWYKEGLSFACTGCGKCCTGSPGAVWINETEVKSLANELQISPEIFLKKYTRLIDGKLSLIEDPVSFDCVFLKNNQCTVYSARPVQCRTFPWWPQNLKSLKDWQDAAAYCEGINLNAPKVPLNVIKDSLHEYEHARSRCRKKCEKLA